MATRTPLQGRFERINLAFLRSRANNTADERHVFYTAMLDYDTYEQYLEAFGEVKVYAPTYGSGHIPITSRRGILYARTKKWIADVPG